MLALSAMHLSSVRHVLMDIEKHLMVTVMRWIVRQPTRQNVQETENALSKAVNLNVSAKKVLIKALTALSVCRALILLIPIVYKIHVSCTILTQSVPVPITEFARSTGMQWYVFAKRSMLVSTATAVTLNSS